MASEVFVLSLNVLGMRLGSAVHWGGSSCKHLQQFGEPQIILPTSSL